MPAWFIGLLVSLTIGFATGVWVTNAQWKATWDAHIAADAKALNKAVADARADEKKQAKLNAASGAKAAVVDQKIQARTRAITKEVHAYVTPAQDARACVSYGAVRLHDAAVFGVQPAELQLPAGKSNDDCSPIAPSALVAAVAENYGVAHQNAEQLNELIAHDAAQAVILNGEDP